MRRAPWWAVLLISQGLGGASLAHTRALQAPSVGQPGWLVLEGGGALRGTAVLRRFLELAGPHPRLVVIPTAGLRSMGKAFTQTDSTATVRWYRNVFGIQDVVAISTEDRGHADADAFVAPLRRATCVWIEGGFHQQLVDSYLGTRTQRELQALYARGGVVGGTSAGAMILGAELFEREAAAAPGRPFNHVLRDTAVHPGFGILANAVIDPHVGARHAEGDLKQLVDLRPRLWGIGIDESTALVIHGDSGVVVGVGRVWIWDHEDHGGKPFYTLTQGQSVRVDRAGADDSGRAVRIPPG